MTGTVDNAASQVLKNISYDGLQMSFTNSDTVALTQGQEVILHTDGTIKKRSAGTEKPLGIIIVPADATKRATVRTNFQAEINGIAKGGTINAGEFVVPNGNKDADGYPEYVAAAAGDFVNAQVIKGGAVDSFIKIGILSSTFKL